MIAHPAPVTPPGAVALHGVFRLGHSSCGGGTPQGSYLSVTFGTRAVRNPQSSCANGNYTLLSRGRDGLSTQSFTPADDAAFDRHGNAVADTIAKPTTFAGHALGLVSDGDNLQDAPTGPREFALPQVYLVGGKLVADLRSVQVLYDGPKDATCAVAAGQGCWLIGAERATGTYDAKTHAFTLSWFSGQSFTSTSAGTVVHLSGTFHGAAKAVPHGQVVELGTQSFAAGHATKADKVAAGTASSSSHRVKSTKHTNGRRKSKRSAAADAASTRITKSTSSSTGTYALGTAAILVDVLALSFLGRKRRSR